jgi:hypothetical protein
MRGFEQARVGDGVSESGSSVGRESIVVRTEKPGWDGGGFHFGKHGSESGREAGSRKKFELGILVLNVEKCGVKNGLQSHEDAILGWDRLIERVYGGMIKAGVGADSF